MSYPPPRYVGETGEINATLRRADVEPDLRTGATGGAHYLATGATTNGQFGLYQWDMDPESGGPGTHFHRTFSESFFVLSGTVRVYDGATWADADAGDFLFVPEGGHHAFRNESKEPASMLILFAPGAPREAYFEELRRLGDLSEEERAAFFERHDTYWV